MEVNESKLVIAGEFSYNMYFVASPVNSSVY